MDRLPPKIVRRLVLAPLAIALSLALLGISPIAFLLAAAVDLIWPKGWRTVRLVAFAVVYLVGEVAGLLALFALWVRSGFGRWMRARRMQDLHYRFVKLWLGAIWWAAAKLFRLRIEIEDPPKRRPGPVLVFSRHAGPGNSLMLVGTIVLGFDRHPRIVMLAKLQWEPLFDVMLNRLPNRFIRHDPKRRDHYLDAIRELADGMGDRDALVLFPEGHDFTPSLRERAIAHLTKRGHSDEAAKARRMRYVLPPRHGGVRAAMEGAPDADVVFVAHSVLEDVGPLRHLWSRIPLAGPVYGRYWRIPQDEVPKGQEELIDYLFAWWARIDEWIRDRIEPPGAHEAAREPLRARTKGGGRAGAVSRRPSPADQG